MATYERAEMHTMRVEFHVPAPPPWGAAWAEVAKAVAACEAELRAAGELKPGEPAWDDQITVAPGEDSVIVSYEARSRVAERAS